MVKEESEQGLQYKVYTREATDKNAEKRRSGTRWRVLVRIAQFHNPVMIGSHCAACFYSSLSIGYSIISFSMRVTYKI